MIQLSERLKIIADNIFNGKTMADIGTDHGFLPLYLWQNKICRKMIMTDVSSGSLAKAEENVRRYCAENGVAKTPFEFRLGDGLSVIKPGEVRSIVIAGMGGVLISKILGACPKKTISFDTYILQPRNGVGKLRFWLEVAGFTIVSEYLAREGKYICEIIVAVSPMYEFGSDDVIHDDVDREVLDDIVYEIPTKIPASQKELFLSFLENKLKIEEKILADILMGNAEAADKITYTEKRIKYLRDLLETELLLNPQ